MKLRLMYALDRFAGVPICFILTVLDTCLHWFRPAPSLRSPRRSFLFIELPEMGSALMAYAAMTRVRERYPQARLYFLIFEKNKESVQVLDVIDDAYILTIDSTSLVSFIITTVAVLRTIRSLGIDVVIDMEIFSRFSAIFSFLTGARERVGFQVYGAPGLYRGRLLNREVTYNYYHHISRNYLALVESLEVETTEPVLKNIISPSTQLDCKKIPQDKTVIARVEQKLRQHYSGYVPGKNKIVVVSPDGGCLPIRAWPAKHYIELGRRLLDDPAVLFVITGRPSACRYNRKITQAVGHDRCINLTGETQLRELIQVFHIASALVAADGGTAHFAAMTGVPVIVMFGPETPVMYAPLGENVHPVFLEYNCSPCLNAFNFRRTSCHDGKCLQNIKVDDIYRMTLPFLQKPKGYVQLPIESRCNRR